MNAHLAAVKVEKKRNSGREKRRQSDLRQHKRDFLCPPSLFSTPNLRQGQLSFAASLQIKFDSEKNSMSLRRADESVKIITHPKVNTTHVFLEISVQGVKVKC
jgi:hypothetical protein